MEACQELKDRLEINNLESYFQPVFNLRTGTILGVEALLRPRTIGGVHLAPSLLFDEAEMSGCLIDLEREARLVALQSFSAQIPDPELILFLNFSATLLNSGSLDPEAILAMVRHYGLAVRNVAVETVESGVQSMSELSRFSASIRNAGFLISLDNFGTEQSSLERVALIRPDIIKIDRSIIDGVSTSPRKRAVLRSVAYLSRTIGALSLAQGLERYEDLLTCATEGIDLAQGFLLGRPGPTLAAALKRRETTADPHFDVLEQDLQEQLRAKSVVFDGIQKAVSSLADQMKEHPLGEMSAALEAAVQDNPIFDCAFVMDETSVQVTQMIMTRQRKRRERHPVFHPATLGTRHFLKDYAYGPIALDHDRYITTPYLSAASGETCRTISRRFSSADGKNLILCVDIPDEPDQ